MLELGLFLPLQLEEFEELHFVAYFSGCWVERATTDCTLLLKFAEVALFKQGNRILLLLVVRGVST